MTYLVSVPAGARALLGDAHAEAGDAAELVGRAEVEGVRLTLVTGLTIRVLLKRTIKYLLSTLSKLKVVSKYLQQRSFLVKRESK